MNAYRSRPSYSVGLACCFLFSAIRLPAGDASLHWRFDSFRAFSEGTLPDGGVNIYPAADGTVRLINAFDLNRDGLPDIFLPSTHGYGNKVDLSIYWDQPGYSPEHVTRLPTDGGRAVAVADLNHDGYPDLVVINNTYDTYSSPNAWIYWGGKDGFSPERRTLLPTVGAPAVGVADLNGDGWPEIIIANGGHSWHFAVDTYFASYIYWNDHGSFSPERRTLLPTINGRDVAVADLNDDGAPDIVFAQAGNQPGEAGARIFWSHGDGQYNLAHSTFLPGEGCTAVAIGDLNRDGRPDIVLANGRRLKGREGDIYTTFDTASLDSYVYWNSPRGFDPARRTGLPTVAVSGVAIADLDRDSWPEVVLSNGEGGASFVYWGSPEGFLPRRRLALPTNNASAVLAADLNRDGDVDLVFAQLNLGPRLDTDSVIYWGGPRGPDAARRQGLPTSGATAVVAADLTQRGRSDLIFCNNLDGTGAETPSSLYLSDRYDPSIFSPARRIEVRTEGLNNSFNGPYSYSAADLNFDGNPDLIIPDNHGVFLYRGGESGYGPEHSTPITRTSAFSARLADFNRDGYLDLALSEWEPGSNGTHIYYGGPGGFSSAASTALPVGGIRFLTIGDFNRDGWLDVAYPEFTGQKITIFWNGPDGFSAGRCTDLPARSPLSVQVADLNADGYLDLVVANLTDPEKVDLLKSKAGSPGAEEYIHSLAFGGSPEADVFIYWGSAAGYSVDRRTVLPAIGASHVAVADLKNNGLLDLVITSYHGGTRRDIPSYIYWQGPNGFDPKNVTRLDTYSASGVMIADFNADGWCDLLFANHQKNGSHGAVDSYLYWGGAQGFSSERRLSLPAKGPHMMAVVDMGNIYDRRNTYSYLSPMKEFPPARELRAIRWTADTPPGTAVRFQIRSAISAAALPQAAWEGAKGFGSDFTTPTDPAGLPLHGPWVQFRALLDNLGGGLPVLRSATLDFD